jgi:hypothetical protein
MIPRELAERVRTDVQRLKEGQDKFLQTYKQLCVHYGGPEWHKDEIEGVFHQVRKEIIPIMEQAGMEPKAVPALCAWAANLVMDQ